MAGFLYHFPDKTIGNWKHAVEAAPVLADVLDDCALSTSHSTFPGPGGQGTLCGVGDVALRYDKDSQTWLDCGGWWLGWERKDPPRPEELARKPLIVGHDVILRDGNAWTIPPLVMLPKGYVRTSDGTLTREIRAEYSDILAFGYRVFDDKPVPLTEAFEFACRVLRLNYRLPEAACLMSGMDLIGDKEVNAMLYALMDGPAVKAMLEKKTA